MTDDKTFALGTFSVAAAEPFAGLVVDERVVPLGAVHGWLSGAGPGLARHDSVLALLEGWAGSFPMLQRAANALAAGKAAPLEEAATAVNELTLHPPVSLPRHIYCSGANYKKHVVQIIVAQAMDETRSMTADERRAWGQEKMNERARTGTPYFFLKPQSAVTGPASPVILPRDVTQPDWELELGVIIGKRARRVKREHALDHVAGYTIVNDITSRDRVNRNAGDLRELGMNWVPGKGSPTYLPMGPWLVPAAFVPNPQDLRINLRLNGEVMQDESTADMIFDVARLVEDLSAAVELQPGDLICTGSPAGNGVHYKRFLRPGDVLEGSITGLGVQRNPCVAEEPT